MKPPGKVAIGIGIVVLVLLLAAGYEAFFRMARIYQWRTDYAELPVDDRALTEWLRSFPGVSEVSVKREGKTVIVNYVMPLMGGSSRPDVHGEDGRLGYKNRGSFTTNTTLRW
ncbi:MAG TPA: hypothetical protein PLN21_22455 [Gemmatales bacterium]|nr:hypothetical protein [Gemmatales bacterium]